MRITSVFESLSVAFRPKCFVFGGVYTTLTSLNYLGADAIDFKGLLTLDHVNELVTFLMLVQREPDARRPLRCIDDYLLPR